jgi:hypothetical protein
VGINSAQASAPMRFLNMVFLDMVTVETSRAGDTQRWTARF